MSSNKLSDFDVLEIYLLMWCGVDGGWLQSWVKVLDFWLHAKWDWFDGLYAQLFLP